MKKLLGFICVLLIAVFAVMPNTYVEAQKDYGNLDMNRWGVLVQTEEKDTLLDAATIDYYSDYTDEIICTLWICNYNNSDGSYVLDNFLFKYKDRSFCLKSYVEYDKTGKVIDSATFPFEKFEKVIPGSLSEGLYYLAFHPEIIDDIKKYVKER